MLHIYDANRLLLARDRIDGLRAVGAQPRAVAPRKRGLRGTGEWQRRDAARRAELRLAPQRP